MHDNQITHLPNGNRVRTGNKQVNNTLTDALLMWPDIISKTLQEVRQKGNSLQQPKKKQYPHEHQSEL